MTIRFACKNCKKAFGAKDALAGKRVACPGCGQPLEVPQVAAKRTSKRPAVEIPDDEEPEPLKLSIKRTEDEGLDMTPMVDVTFLLLIFFMVTAAFSLQMSIEVPAPEKDETAEQARTVEDLKEDDFIIIQISKDDVVWVNDREAPSEQDLLIKLRDARSESSDSGGASSLLVMADRECRHETVVMALDAGNAVGLEDIRLAYVDEDDL